MKSAGRLTFPARPVIGSVEVLDAEKGVRRQMRLDLLEHLGLDGRVLEHGLDHELGAGGVGRVGGRRDPRQQLVGLLLGRAPALDGLGDELLRVALAALARPRARRP